MLNELFFLFWLAKKVALSILKNYIFEHSAKKKQFKSSKNFAEIKFCYI